MCNRLTEAAFHLISQLIGGIAPETDLFGFCSMDIIELFRTAGQICDSSHTIMYEHFFICMFSADFRLEVFRFGRLDLT